MRLLLIRHGQTPGNVLGQLDTAHPGPGLTDTGLAQAEALARTLADDPLDAIFSSTLVRTQLTAAPLARARHLETGVLPGLHEIQAGSLELRSDRDAIHQYLETVFAWGLGDLSATMPGGHDGNEFFGRFDADIASIAANHGGTVAVVSHGAAIRVWVSSRARNIEPAFGAEHHLDNTGVVVLEGDPAAGWVLTEWAGSPVPDATLP